jgi:hypothetical protein
MSDIRVLLLSVLLNAAVTSALGGLVLWWLRTWLGRKIDSKFKLLEERAKVELEVEKTQALSLLDRRNTIYPEILEVVYRLRNITRDVLAIFPADVLSWDVGVGRSRESTAKIRAFESALYLLTENLYKYRAFVEEDVFDKLHQFKRNLQDASVVVDRLTRPKEGQSSRPYAGHDPAEDVVEIYVALINKLRALYEDSDKLYHEVTTSIKEDLNGNSLLESRHEQKAS